NREYDFMFDNSTDALMLFSAKRHDISDQILASIRRNSRKLSGPQKEDSSNNLDEYKSVKQARLDEEAEEEREAIKKAKEDERKAMMDARQRERDTIRAARQAEFKTKKDRIKNKPTDERNTNQQKTNPT